MLKQFGEDLKKLRELRGVTLAEISANTRINVKFLENLEEGNFEFQPQTYIRSFIKEFARCIGESEKIMLNEYDKARAGFYTRRKFGDETEDKPDEKSLPTVVSKPEKKEEPVYKEEIKQSISVNKPFKDYDDNSLSKKELSDRSWTQKILLILLILVVSAGVFYLVKYLNDTGENKNTNVKPKTFSEISEDYESKHSKTKISDSIRAADSLKSLQSDSLSLIVKVSKDTRVKVYVDERKIIEEDLKGKDSLLIRAKEQFRFSSNSNQSVELYLNGRYLKKPASLTSSSIKNLVINKDGILNK